MAGISHLSADYLGYMSEWVTIIPGLQMLIANRYPRRERKPVERFTFPPDWRCADDNSDDNDSDFNPDGDSDVTSEHSEESKDTINNYDHDDSWIEEDEEEVDSECSYTNTSQMDESDDTDHSDD